MSTTYPKFNSIYFSCCYQSAAAEILIAKELSTIYSVSASTNSFALELRRYSNDMFMSGRISSRAKVSLGAGCVSKESHFSLVPVFGVSYGLKTQEVKPFITFTFGLQ